MVPPSEAPSSSGPVVAVLLPKWGGATARELRGTGAAGADSSAASSRALPPVGGGRGGGEDRRHLSCSPGRPGMASDSRLRSDHVDTAGGAVCRHRPPVPLGTLQSWPLPSGSLSLRSPCGTPSDEAPTRDEPESEEDVEVVDSSEIEEVADGARPSHGPNEQLARSLTTLLRHRYPAGLFVPLGTLRQHRRLRGFPDRVMLETLAYSRHRGGHRFKSHWERESLSVALSDHLHTSRRALGFRGRGRGRAPSWR